MVLGRSIAAVAGGKLMCLQNMPEQTNEETYLLTHLFAPACPEIPGRLQGRSNAAVAGVKVS